MGSCRPSATVSDVRGPVRLVTVSDTVAHCEKRPCRNCRQDRLLHNRGGEIRRRAEGETLSTEGANSSRPTTSIVVQLQAIGAARFAVVVQTFAAGKVLATSCRRAAGETFERAARDYPIRLAVHALTCIHLHSHAFP